MQLKFDTSGPTGLLDVLPDGTNPPSPDSALRTFPERLGTGTIQRFTLSPSLFMMLHHYTLTADVKFHRRAEPGDEHIITFSFRDVVRPATQLFNEPQFHQSNRPLPSVQVSSSDA